MKPKTNTFDLIYGMYARQHGITTDYMKCSYAHKCGVLKEIATELNGDWKPSFDWETGEVSCLVANLETGLTDAMTLDSRNVGQDVVFSPEAAEQAKDIIPFDFLKSFWL